MTHSNHRFTTLSADDVALCRAHSEAIASEPDCVVWARITDTKASLVELERKVAYHAACDDFERVTLDQAQSDAYWQWQREVHSSFRIGVDLAQPGGDTTVIALATAKSAAKSAAEQPAKSQDASGWRRGPDVPMSERVGLWFYKTQCDGKIGRASDASTFSFDCPGEYMRSAPGVRYGDPYDESKYAASDLAARLASTSSAANGAALIGANPDVPAQQPAQKASTHSVCIKAHGFADWQVGDVWPGATDEFAHPEYWLPCDESGWVTHVPTADAVCPVPDGVGHETKRRCGDILGGDCSTSLAWQLGHEERRVPHEDDIIAWRPIAQI